MSTNSKREEKDKGKRKKKNLHPEYIYVIWQASKKIATYSVIHIRILQLWD